MRQYSMTFMTYGSEKKKRFNLMIFSKYVYINVHRLSKYVHHIYN